MAQETPEVTPTSAPEQTFIGPGPIDLVDGTEFVTTRENLRPINISTEVTYIALGLHTELNPDSEGWFMQNQQAYQQGSLSLKDNWVLWRPKTPLNLKFQSNLARFKPAPGLLYVKSDGAALLSLAAEKAPEGSLLIGRAEFPTLLVDALKEKGKLPIRTVFFGRMD